MGEADLEERIEESCLCYHNLARPDILCYLFFIGALFHRRERVNEAEDGNHTKLGYPPVKKNNVVSKHLRVHAEVF